MTPSQTTVAAYWSRRFWLIQRLAHGRMTVEEFEEQTVPSPPGDGLCPTYGHVASGSDLFTCAVCGASMP